MREICRFINGHFYNTGRAHDRLFRTGLTAFEHALRRGSHAVMRDMVNRTPATRALMGGRHRDSAILVLNPLHDNPFQRQADLEKQA